MALQAACRVKYKAVIFDLDGTLVHTTPEYRYLVVGGTLERLGVKSYDKRHVDKFWFEAGRSEIIRHDFGVVPEEFWGIYRTLDTAEFRKGYAAAYDDVSFIAELRRRGYKLGIVTGAPLEIAGLETALLGTENFDAIVVAHTLNGIRPKPHPDGLERCMNLLGVGPRETVYVGNAEEDVRTARNADVFDVIVRRGEYEFTGMEPSLEIDSLFGLRGILP